MPLLRAPVSISLVLLLCITMISSAPLPLLFIGNSYTYYNDLPIIVQNLLADSSPTPAQWLIGGHFWRQDSKEAADNSTALYGYLRAPSKWRAVIYQEQSIAPSLWTCSNSEQESEWSASSFAILELNKLAHALEGSPTAILYEKSLDLPNVISFPDYSSMQAALIEGYRRYNASLTQNNYPAVMAPVGHAFRVINLDANAVVDFDSLYSSDGSHPSPLGSYLAGLLIASCISGASPSSFAFISSGVTQAQAAYLRGVAVQAFAQISVLFNAPSQSPQDTTQPPATQSKAPSSSGSSATTPPSTSPSTSGAVSTSSPSPAPSAASPTPAPIATPHTPSPYASTPVEPPVRLSTPLWAWLLGAIVVVLFAVTAYGVYFRRRHHHREHQQPQQLEDVNIPLAEDNDTI